MVSLPACKAFLQMLYLSVLAMGPSSATNTTIDLFCMLWLLMS